MEKKPAGCRFYQRKWWVQRFFSTTCPADNQIIDLVIMIPAELEAGIADHQIPFETSEVLSLRGQWRFLQGQGGRLVARVSETWLGVSAEVSLCLFGLAPWPDIDAAWVST